MFALESAMDELAVKLGMDPIELRRINDTRPEPIKRLPYTSRSLMPCFDAGRGGLRLVAARPAAGRDARRRLAGRLGLRDLALPDQHRPGGGARAPDAERRRCACRPPRTRSAPAPTPWWRRPPRDGLGVRSRDVTVEMGDTDLPPAPVAGRLQQRRPASATPC